MTISTCKDVILNNQDLKIYVVLVGLSLPQWARLPSWVHTCEVRRTGQCTLKHNCLTCIASRSRCSGYMNVVVLEHGIGFACAASRSEKMAVSAIQIFSCIEKNRTPPQSIEACLHLTAASPVASTNFPHKFGDALKPLADLWLFCLLFRLRKFQSGQKSEQFSALPTKTI